MSEETPPGLLMRIRNAMFRMVGLTTEPLVVPMSKSAAQRDLNERASALILELSHQLFDLVPQVQADWSKAYYRFCLAADGNTSAACSTDDKETRLADVALHAGFFGEIDEKAAKLIKLFGKQQGVLLLIVKSDATYKVDFDWGDLGRWPIDGSGRISGLPQQH